MPRTSTRFRTTPPPFLPPPPPPPPPPRRALLDNLSLVEILRDTLDWGREALMYLEGRPNLVEAYEYRDVQDLRDELERATLGLRRLARDGYEAAEQDSRQLARELDAPPPAPKPVADRRGGRKPAASAPATPSPPVAAAAPKRKPGRPKTPSPSSSAIDAIPAHVTKLRGRRANAGQAASAGSSAAAAPGATLDDRQLEITTPSAKPLRASPPATGAGDVVCGECGCGGDEGHSDSCSKSAPMISRAQWREVSKGPSASVFALDAHTMKEIGTPELPSAKLSTFAESAKDIAKQLPRCAQGANAVFISDVLDGLIERYDRIEESEDDGVPLGSNRKALLAAHEAGLIRLRCVAPTAAPSDPAIRAKLRSGELRLNGATLHLMIVEG